MNRNLLMKFYKIVGEKVPEFKGGVKVAIDDVTVIESS